MNHIKKIAGVGLLLAGVANALANDTNSYSATPNVSVPDGSQIGIPLHINSTATGLITGLTVNLNITGGYNGDLYAYLSGPNGGFAVLLNRTGLNGSDDSSLGYSDAGFNITLDDNAAHNIHYYQDFDNPNGGQLMGAWQPDGENVDSTTSNDVGTPAGFMNPATLESFLGADPSGTWTLFVSDLAQDNPKDSNDSTVVSWGMTIVTVPEPQTWAFAGMGLMGLVAASRWKRK